MIYLGLLSNNLHCICSEDFSPELGLRALTISIDLLEEALNRRISIDV